MNLPPHINHICQCLSKSWEMKKIQIMKEKTKARGHSHILINIEKSYILELFNFE